MLSERVKEWNKKWIEQGRFSERVSLVIRLAEKKFGSVPGETRERIESGSAEQLLEWSDRILTADRLGDIFAK